MLILIGCNDAIVEMTCVLIIEDYDTNPIKIHLYYYLQSSYYSYYTKMINGEIFKHPHVYPDKVPRQFPTLLLIIN